MTQFAQADPEFAEVGQVQTAQGRSWVRNDFYRRELAQMNPDRTSRRGAPLEVFAGHVLAPVSLRRFHP